ncbi:hypothetical protein A0H81_04829 [Grifola frondosa]|uniref:Uncharacterized protein n=1 Tax=Grifola frondosa TaxID=5627 RepID=A0A1C7MGN9_GRIFR|nr:hypothetical protein A0H81_04829 [Grifola frondosa]
MLPQCVSSGSRTSARHANLARRWRNPCLLLALSVAVFVILRGLGDALRPERPSVTPIRVGPKRTSNLPAGRWNIVFESLGLSATLTDADLHDRFDGPANPSRVISRIDLRRRSFEPLSARPQASFHVSAAFGSLEDEMKTRGVSTSVEEIAASFRAVAAPDEGRRVVQDNNRWEEREEVFHRRG